MSGKLLVISGPSGAGKSTVLDLFKKHHPDWLHLPSMTTRSIRQDETNGVDYHFISKREFHERIKAGDLLEHFTVTDNLYGTPKSPIEEALQKGHDVVVIKEVNGALAIKKAFPSAILVAIVLENWGDLTNRLSSRVDTNREFIDKRLRLAQDEIKQLDKFHQVINPQGHPEKALAAVEKLLDL